MPVWLMPIVNFISKRFIHFLVYLLLGLITIGIPYKWFFKPKPPEFKAGSNYYACTPETPIVGCSISKLYLKAVWK
jgi:hypothetical protein